MERRCVSDRTVIMKKSIACITGAALLALAGCTTTKTTTTTESTRKQPTANMETPDARASTQMSERGPR